MRKVSVDPVAAADTAAPLAHRAVATLPQQGTDRLRWLQRTVGNRATASLLRQSAICDREPEAAAPSQVQHRPGEPDQFAGALRAAIVARNGAAAARTPPGVSSRNPDPETEQAEDEEIVTRSCSVSTGPTYTPSGTIPVTTTGGRKRATFSFASTFKNASWWEFWSSADAACCEVRQYIKWDKAFHDWNGGPPHSGFPSASSYGTWYEDRDTSDKRYGHRGGVHSDPIAGGGDEYTTNGVRDQANGDQYNGRDAPGGPTAMTGQFQFRLGVIDSCNSNTTKASSPVITVNW